MDKAEIRGKKVFFVYSMSLRTCIELLIEYFYPWRPYKLMFIRLKGGNCPSKVLECFSRDTLYYSASWLKRQYRRLMLQRRPMMYMNYHIIL